MRPYTSRDSDYGASTTHSQVHRGTTTSTTPPQSRPRAWLGAIRTSASVPATVRKRGGRPRRAGLYIQGPTPPLAASPMTAPTGSTSSLCSPRKAPHVPSHQRSAISRRFRKVEDDMDQWGSVAAALIAQIVGNLGIATFPKTSVSRVKHLELVPVQDFLALLIVVLEQAKLRKQLIRFREPLDNTEMESMSTRLRSHVTGLSHHEIAVQPMSLTPTERQAVDATIVMLREEGRLRSRRNTTFADCATCSTSPSSSTTRRSRPHRSRHRGTVR